MKSAFMLLVFASAALANAYFLTGNFGTSADGSTALDNQAFTLTFRADPRTCDAGGCFLDVYDAHLQIGATSYIGNSNGSAVALYGFNQFSALLGFSIGQLQTIDTFRPALNADNTLALGDLGLQSARFVAAPGVVAYNVTGTLTSASIPEPATGSVVLLPLIFGYIANKMRVVRQLDYYCGSKYSV